MFFFIINRLYVGLSQTLEADDWFIRDGLHRGLKTVSLLNSSNATNTNCLFSLFNRNL